jgi:putative transposase
MGELTAGLARYFVFYNEECPHQSLGYTTPDVVYRTAIGGGAVIVDKYPCAVEVAEKATSGQCGPETNDVSRAA